MSRNYPFFIRVVRSCKTKEQLEVACDWIRGHLGQLPNAALDYDYNMKQAKLMPLYRAMTEMGSELGLLISPRFNSMEVSREHSLLS